MAKTYKDSNWLNILGVLCVLKIFGVTACNIESIENERKTYLPSQINNISCIQDCCASLKPRPPMTYYYYQNTGTFKGGSSEWAINTHGYSGQGAGYMNPDFQCKPGGPLPASIYTVAFCKNIMHESTNRPCAFYLKPQKFQQVCGRDDFFIHGCHCCTPDDDTQPPYPGCSAGCIVISYQNRKKIRVGDSILVFNYQAKLSDE